MRVRVSLEVSKIRKLHFYWRRCGCAGKPNAISGTVGGTEMIWFSGLNVPDSCRPCSSGRLRVRPVSQHVYTIFCEHSTLVVRWVHSSFSLPSRVTVVSSNLARTLTRKYPSRWWGVCLCPDGRFFCSLFSQALSLTSPTPLTYSKNQQRDFTKRANTGQFVPRHKTKVYRNNPTLVLGPLCYIPVENIFRPNAWALIPRFLPDDVTRVCSVGRSFLFFSFVRFALAWVHVNQRHMRTTMKPGHYISAPRNWAHRVSSSSRTCAKTPNIRPQFSPLAHLKATRVRGPWRAHLNEQTLRTDRLCELGHDTRRRRRYALQQTLLTPAQGKMHLDTVDISGFYE